MSKATSRCKNRIVSLMAAVLFLTVSIFSTSVKVMAAEPGTVYDCESTKDSAVMYVRMDREPDAIDCQIGTQMIPSEQITYAMLGQEEVPFHTLYLIDNSLSVKSEYRTQIKEILTDLLSVSVPGEMISIAYVSDTITYVIEDSTDRELLQQAIDGIEHFDQETYLTDVLYELLKGWNEDADYDFHRIVLLSDGMDNKEIGYTKEELYDLIKAHPYPIYTVGCPTKSNGDALSAMYALSRLSAAESFTISELESNQPVVDAVAESTQVLQVTTVYPADICDGTQKGISLTLTCGGEQLKAEGIIHLPFMVAEIEEVPEPEEPAEEPAEEIVEEPASEPEAEQKDYSMLLLILLIAGVLAVVTLVIVLVIVLRRRKQEDEAFIEAPGSIGHQRILTLTNLNSPAIVYETPMIGNVIVGRSREDGCRIVIEDDLTVSRRHFCIRMVEETMLIRDLGSDNGTFIEGRRVKGEIPVMSGSIVKAGRVVLRIGLR